MLKPEDLLGFWFAGDPTAFRVIWFRADAAFDAACSCFSETLRAAKQGLCDDWADTPHGALALVILLDQLSRNLFRGSPEAFAADERARSVARAAIARGFDLALFPTERLFFYMPFEHSEALADQDEAVRLFDALHDEIGDDAVRAASEHREVIRRFGRFPHRNAALGRLNTADEAAYLAEPGAGFQTVQGQAIE